MTFFLYKKKKRCSIFRDWSFRNCFWHHYTLTAIVKMGSSRFVNYCRKFGRECLLGTNKLGSGSGHTLNNFNEDPNRNLIAVSSIRDAHFLMGYWWWSSNEQIKIGSHSARALRLRVPANELYRKVCWRKYSILSSLNEHLAIHEHVILFQIVGFYRYLLSNLHFVHSGRYCNLHHKLVVQLSYDEVHQPCHVILNGNLPMSHDFSYCPSRKYF